MPSEAEAPNPARGWLTVYYVYVLVAAVLCLMEVIGSRPWADYGPDRSSLMFLIALFKFGVYAFAANSLKRLDTRWVVNFHIGLNAVSAVLAGLMIFGYAVSLSIATLVPWPLIFYFEHPLMYPVLPLIWTIYWVVSKRVRTAYPATGTSGVSPLWIRIPGLPGVLDRWSTRAWVMAMLIAAVSTLVPWIINSWTWLRMGLSNPSGERWPLIYFAYPLVLLAIWVAAYQLIARRKFRWARIVAASPFALFILSGAADLNGTVTGMQSMRVVDAKIAQRIRENDAIRRAANPEGPFTEFYDNGQKKAEGHYDDNGLPDGLVTKWYPSGQKESEVTYADGKQTPPIYYWHEDGQKAYESRYVDGNYVGDAAWYPNGQISHEIFRGPPGSAAGERKKTWYENGQQQWDYCYVGEGRIKYSLTWDESGTLTSPPYDGDLECP